MGVLQVRRQVCGRLLAGGRGDLPMVGGELPALLAEIARFLRRQAARRFRGLVCVVASLSPAPLLVAFASPVTLLSTLGQPAKRGRILLPFVEPPRRLRPHPRVVPLHPAARLTRPLVVGVIAERPVQQPDGLGSLALEQRRLGAGGRASAAGQRFLWTADVHGEGECAGCPCPPRRQEIVPDRLFGWRVDPVGRHGPRRNGGNGQNKLPFALVGELPAADQHGELVMASRLAPAHETGHNGSPLLVELGSRLHDGRIGRDPRARPRRKEHRRSCQ